ncbi:MAG TPA: DUF1501 domain-containing protein [Urbifossiella sp.]|nr:DUF1501 domain-containing protein [Urbifossiella sp.]
MLNTTEATRRKFLQLSALGVGGVGLSGWLDVLAARATAQAPAARPAGRARSVVLLWMDGGPSHKDTLDLKPDSRGAGEFKPIATSATGIQISEHLPKLARHMNRGVLVRGMSTPEGAHPRAKYNLHTGYREGQGGLVYPSLGSIVASEAGRAESPLPAFVSVGARSYGSGFLGPKYQPLQVQDPARGVEDLRATVGESQFGRRMGLLEEMERAFHGEYRAPLVTDHQTTYERAVRLMQAREGRAFDISQEPAANKAKYGTGKFAEGALMARRLVEVGVPFVEVGLGGWDTHADNFDRVRNLSTQVDNATAALLDDLQQRGLLDSTLVIWIGEFGRTPNINTRGPKPGRDHFPRAWSLAMWGGGLRGGRVVGRTDREGASVEEGKVGAPDFLATVCELVGIDHTKKNETPAGRPVAIVDKAKPFTNLIV